MGVVQMSRGNLPPVSDRLRSEVDIVAGLAAEYHAEGHPVPWKWLAEDYDRIRSLIERVVPGFENYTERAGQPGGFYLPNPAKRRVWVTPARLAVFSTAEMDRFEPAGGRLILQTIRSHDQFNTTIYGLNDRYRGIGNARRIVLVNPDDLAERGIPPCSLVDMVGIWKDERRVAKSFTAVPYEMPRGSAAAYFPEANILVPADSQATGSGTPTSKTIEIDLVLRD
jgi:anaerobic selenocysteine-containing dehydrogenase